MTQKVSSKTYVRTAMLRKQLLCFLLLCSCLFSAKIARSQQTLYALSGASGTASILYKLNPANGALVATVGNTGLSHLSALAVHPQTGVIYAAGYNPNTGLAHLYSLDSSTGAATSIGSIGNIQVPDMTFSSGGTLYAWGEPFADGIFTIDITTGAATQTGSCGCVTSVTGLSFNSTCTQQLYLKNAGTLSVIDQATSQVISTVTASATLHNMLAVDKYNVMYSGQRGTGGFILKTIDPATGVVTTIGTASGVANISAIAFGTYAFLSASATATNVLCYGNSTGSVDLTVAGGVAPYSYSWSNGASTEDISSLAAGSYTVTVTDANGCTASASATVTQPSAALTASSGGQTNATSGNNGSATVVANGGTTPYSYSWAPYGGTNATATGLGAGTFTATVTDANGCTANQTFTITQACNISFTASVTNVTCNGNSNGAINITMTSGAGSYTYSWSNGATTKDISGLAAGTYTLTVSLPNGCQATQTYTVTQPEPLTPNGSVTNVSCYNAQNGAIDITVTGGTAPYSYTWADVNSNNFLLWIFYYFGQWCNNNNNNTNWPGSNIHTEDRTGLDNGCYYVKVTDANGCTAIASFTITQPAPINVSYTKSNAGCANNNGSINQSVSGGTAPYTYLWSNGATTQDVSGLSAGSYYVTVTDANGCSVNRSYSISQATSNISVSCNSTTSATCAAANGAINISVSGGSSPYTYQWSNGATTQDISGLTSGSYTVVITDNNGCTKTQTYNVGQTNGNISVSCQSTTSATCAAPNGAINISVSGGTSPYTYQWSNGATTQDISGLTSGSYTVVITDRNGCTKTQTYTVGQTNGNISVSVSKTNANCSNTGGAINITVSGGTSPYTYQWSNGATTQDISNVSAGTYTVVITDHNGCVKTQSYSISQSSGNVNASISVSPVYPLSGQQAYTIYLGYGAQSVTLTASASGGSGPYTRQWSSTTSTSSSITVSPTTTTTYTLTVTDANGCSDVATKTITVVNPAAPNNKVYVCHNGNTTAVSQSQLNTHLCHGDNLGPCTSGYYCRSSGGGGNEEGELVEEQTLSEIARELKFNIYPNPSSGVFTVDLPETGDVRLVVCDLSGKVVAQKAIPANQAQKVEMDLSGLAKGMYVLTLQIGSHTWQQKLGLQN